MSGDGVDCRFKGLLIEEGDDDEVSVEEPVVEEKRKWH
jgi:hypothetical protein